MFACVFLFVLTLAFTSYVCALVFVSVHCVYVSRGHRFYKLNVISEPNVMNSRIIPFLIFCECKECLYRQSVCVCPSVPGKMNHSSD